MSAESGCSRREYLRRVGVGGVTIAAGGTASTGTASAALTVPFARRAASGTVELLTDRWGSSDDTPTQAEIRAQYHADATEMEINQQNQFEDIENQMAMLRDFVRQNVIFQIGEQLNLEDADRSDVIGAAEDEVAEQVASIQKSQLNMFTTYLTMTTRRMALTWADPDVNESQVWQLSGPNITTNWDEHEQDVDKTDPDAVSTSWNGVINWLYQPIHIAGLDGDDYSFESHEADVLAAVDDWYDDYYPDGTPEVMFEATPELENGEAYQVPIFAADNEPHPLFIPWSDDRWDFTESREDGAISNGDDGEFTEIDGDYNRPGDFLELAEEFGSGDLAGEYITRLEVMPEDAGMSSATAIDASDYIELWEELAEIAEDEKEHAVQMAETIYDGVQNGTIELDEVTWSSPAKLLEAADDPDDYVQLAGRYRAANYAEADEPATVELNNGIELEGILFRTIPDDPLPVGETIDPDGRIGGIHISAEVTAIPDDPDGEAAIGPDDVEEGDLVPIQLTDPFEILETDSDLDALEFESREVTDPEMTAEEIQERLHETYQIELETTAGTENGGGGGGGGSDGLSDAVLIGVLALLAAAVAAVGLAGGEN